MDKQKEDNTENTGKINIGEKIAQGWIHARTIIEVAGKPKEHVDQAIRMYVDHFKNDKELIVLIEDFSDAELQEGTEVYSAIVELEILFKNTPKLVWFCFDYLPASVEIIEPQTLIYKSKDFSNFLNDLQGRMHTISDEVKKLTLSNSLLEKNSKNLLRNFIYMCLRNKPCTIEEVAGIIGIKPKELEPFMKELIDLSSIEKKEDKYFLKQDDSTKEQD